MVSRFGSGGGPAAEPPSMTGDRPMLEASDVAIVAEGTELLGVVSASDIAAYSFCPEAWRLGAGLNLQADNGRQLARGEESHAKIAVRAADQHSTAPDGLII